MSILGDVLISLGLFVGGMLTGAHYALNVTAPGKLCTCGHYEVDHVDGVCDATQYCDCPKFTAVRR